MKVRLEKSIALAAQPAAAWALLQQIESVAGCVPGARITEQVDERRYKGTVTVRLGPASIVFRGEVEVREVDAATRTLVLAGRGTDTTGTSGATLDLRAQVVPGEGDACILAGTSEVSVSGKVASFGARLMSSVADQVLGQFAANFAERLRSMPPPAGMAPSEAAPPAPAAGDRELNGLALLWTMVRQWFASVFGVRRA